MAFWGVLLELARAVVPHAAPHVARVVVDAARERRAASTGAGRTQTVNQPTNESLAEAITYLDRRIGTSEEKFSELEQRLLEAETQTAARWEHIRKLIIGLIAWNGVVTAALIALIVYLLVRR